VFGVRDDLVMDYQECRDLEELPDDLSIGRDVTVPFYKVDFDFVLVPE
jgi:hypothetical protein